MKFSNCEMRPGVVLAVCNNYGTVKASCLGMFSEEDDVDLLPPIFPWFKTSNTAFSEPQIGDQILILIDHDNPQNLRYMFMGDAVNNNDEILSDGCYDDCEILSKRNNSKLMWSDSEGWRMENGKSNVRINPEGDISISYDNDKSYIEVTKEGINLGGDGDPTPAVLGNELKDCIQSLIKCIQSAAKVGKTNPHTLSMATILESGLIEVNDKLSNILSKNITIN